MSMKNILMATSIMAAAMMGGTTGQHRWEDIPREPLPPKPFLTDVEVPKGHIKSELQFGLEVRGNIISGSIMFTYVKNKEISREKRGAARLRELVDYLMRTPDNKLKEFKQFEINPIENGETTDR